MEYHVSATGSDTNEGTFRAPLRTISAAARLAEPGDTVTVHAGTYREWVNPPRGGDSDERRIVYRAADGERVEIKGSEVVRDWERVSGPVWKLVLPNAFFGGYNPYADRIRGDWFNDMGRDHHTGRVYINETPLVEAASLDGVMSGDEAELSWYASVTEETTTIWARFDGADPNRETVEINVRPAVFYPDQPGRNYITVRGFIMRHAATQWAPPTTEQIGLIGTHWSRGWIIEENVISDSRCTGITLGKYGKSVDDTGATADRYNETIRHALRNGWEKGTVGGHIVRNNTIYRCEQAGIVGSMGAAFSEVSGNHIHHVHFERRFGGAEMAGIKFHGAVDTILRGNRIHHASLGMWLDWMTQGTRVTGNLLYENGRDLFVEVSHGPYLVDNNLFLSRDFLLNMSQGGAYVHNLIAGRILQAPDLSRSTPYHKEHSTEVAGLSVTRGGDDRFYHNIFIGGGLATYDKTYEEWTRRQARDRGLSEEWVKEQLAIWQALDEPRVYPVWMKGNVFFDGAEPSRHEAAPIRIHREFKLEWKDEGEHVYLLFDADPEWAQAWASLEVSPVTTESLGRARVPDLPYTQPDGAPLVIDTDYFGARRETGASAPGPFAELGSGRRVVKVWPLAPDSSK